jgi:hypothetical protein
MRKFARGSDGCYFEITVTEQYLDGAQVGPGFEKMCGEAMAPISHGR